MKTAILYAPDWPQDEVALVVSSDEADRLSPFLEMAQGYVGPAGAVVAIADRTAFKVIHRQVRNQLQFGTDAERNDPILQAIGQAMESAARRLNDGRLGDKSGDPVPAARPEPQTAEA